MPYALILLAFILKHGVASNIIDLGYTRSRERHESHWVGLLVIQCLLDVAMSIPAYFLLPFGPIGYLWIVVEFAGLVLSCLIERLPSYAWMIVVHILSEIGMIFLYAAMTYFLLRGT
jgi:hypothetical protein